MTETFIFDAVRTPRGKGRSSGALHGTTPISLAITALQALRDRNTLDTAFVDDIILGCVEPAGGGPGDRGGPGPGGGFDPGGSGVAQWRPSAIDSCRRRRPCKAASPVRRPPSAARRPRGSNTG